MQNHTLRNDSASFFKRTKYSILKNDEGHHECLFTEIQASVKMSF